MPSNSELRDINVPRLELIDMVDKFIHATTRLHIPDYPEAQELLTSLSEWRDRAVEEARLDQIESDFLFYSIETNVDESELIRIRDIMRAAHSSRKETPDA